ncbi:SRR1-domain-containing protein [Stereum hirsutum FP-91666 SS1]|uniref:SRR1-domain-containing protein n=1 Tax=Stereum hirsutum (strain FP-91666) TaxID=721885 RepID=UPI000440FCA9|nr:SRR1-domain-containing protein [Stereum hirsutum FP-91666 SS1]EIM90416.1 SRR1-domain-containing protein [Stereum hirsutum FP-91666 SS1]
MSATLEASPFQYNDSFKPSKSRKRRKHPTQTPNAADLYTRCAEELKSGSWLDQCHRLMTGALTEGSSHFSRVLCLGLGCPTSSKEARAQLALLLEICQRNSLDLSRIFVYDPVFTDEDVKFLNGLQISVLSENKHGRYSIETPTLLFMPHCDKKLYERLLRENWTPERLSNLFMICNNFREYLDSHPSHVLMAEFPCISRLTPYLSTRPLPTGSTYPNAFTSTAIQYIAALAPSTPQTQTQTQTPALPPPSDNAFWELPPELGAQAEDDQAPRGHGAQAQEADTGAGSGENDGFVTVGRQTHHQREEPDGCRLGVQQISHLQLQGENEERDTVDHWQAWPTAA